jgi:exonuclease III
VAIIDKKIAPLLTRAPCIYCNCVGEEEQSVWGEPEHEGRVITLEFGKLAIVSIYAPSPSSPARIATRFEWNKQLGLYLRTLRKKGLSLLLVGDINVTESDLDCTLSEEWAVEWLDPPGIPATSEKE